MCMSATPKLTGLKRSTTEMIDVSESSDLAFKGFICYCHSYQRKNLSTGAVQRQTYKNQEEDPQASKHRPCEDEIVGSPKKIHSIQTWETSGGISTGRPEGPGHLHISNNLIFQGTLIVNHLKSIQRLPKFRISGQGSKPWNRAPESN